MEFYAFCFDTLRLPMDGGNSERGVLMDLYATVFRLDDAGRVFSCTGERDIPIVMTMTL